MLSAFTIILRLRGHPFLYSECGLERQGVPIGGTSRNGKKSYVRKLYLELVVTYCSNMVDVHICSTLCYRHLLLYYAYADILSYIQSVG